MFARDYKQGRPCTPPPCGVWDSESTNGPIYQYTNIPIYSTLVYFGSGLPSTGGPYRALGRGERRVPAAPHERAGCTIPREKTAVFADNRKSLVKSKVQQTSEAHCHLSRHWTAHCPPAHSVRLEEFWMAHCRPSSAFDGTLPPGSIC